MGAPTAGGCAGAVGVWLSLVRRCGIAALRADRVDYARFNGGKENGVNTDDEIRREELVQRIKRMNELKVTVLNSHLTLERFINEFLDASGKKHRG